MGVQYPPEFIETGKGLFFFLPSLFDNTYDFVGDTFATTVDAKNVGFQFILLPSLANPPCPPLPKGGEIVLKKIADVYQTYIKEKVTDSSQIGLNWR
ncbi:MAG: hypothetical protein HY787_28040 [Deltaproteobacteria bacterium]|nr:hypothetical protein [Deltaproteobacteria bacterium]